MAEPRRPALARRREPAADPLVSVVITAYNRPGFLRDALSSVLAQTYRPIEIVVIDDCSPTDLSGVVASFAADIRYHRQAENGGLSHARNTGVALAGGQYVAFLDDDDRWLPHKLARQMRAIEGHDACLCGFAVMETGQSKVRPVGRITPEMLLYGNKFCGPTGLLCRRAVLRRELFDTGLKWGEDWDMYVRLCRQAPIAYCRDALFLRRTSDPDSMTNKIFARRGPDRDIIAGHLVKQRAWLGRRIFRRRLVEARLAYIRRQRNKLAIVRATLREAGPAAMAWYVWQRLTRGHRGLQIDRRWLKERGIGRPRKRTVRPVARARSLLMARDGDGSKRRGTPIGRPGSVS